MTDISDEEIRLRLIEAAVQLPAVRMVTHLDGSKGVAAAAHIVADLWYNRFVKVKNSGKAQPVKASSKGS